MISKVVFFNFFHNGDLHVSRSLVKIMANEMIKKGIRCEYYHRCHPLVLADVPVQHTCNRYGINSEYIRSHISGDTAFINTWYAADQGNFGRLGITFDTIYHSFVDYFKLLDLNIENYDKFSLFPEIDYTKYKIENCINWLSSHTNKKVFISNGNTLSGQAENFSFAPVINNLARNNPDVSFLVSNKDESIMRNGNVFFTQDVIAKNDLDLNENSFLAKSCDLIVGRYSGTYTFSMTKTTYYDNPRKFICFMNDASASWIYDILPQPYANIFTSKHTGAAEVTSIIQQGIN